MTSYWCFRCKERFYLRGQEELTCPTCHDGFVAETPRMHHLRIEPLVSVDQPNRRPSHSSLAIVGPSGPNGRPTVRGLVEFEGRLSNNIDDRGSSGPDSQQPLTFIFHGQHISISNLQEFARHMNDDELQFRPPPASRAAINAMPIVSVTQMHLDTDSTCPICKEEFELGSNLRKMPCNHLYHQHCIFEWLQRHHTCPVCRFKMPTGGAGGGSSSSSSVGTSSRGRANRRGNLLSCFWPFGSSNSNTPRGDDA